MGGLGRAAGQCHILSDKAKGTRAWRPTSGHNSDSGRNKWVGGLNITFGPSPSRALSHVLARWAPVARHLSFPSRKPQVASRHSR